MINFGVLIAYDTCSLLRFLHCTLNYCINEMGTMQVYSWIFCELEYTGFCEQLDSCHCVWTHAPNARVTSLPFDEKE